MDYTRVDRDLVLAFATQLRLNVGALRPKGQAALVATMTDEARLKIPRVIVRAAKAARELAEVSVRFPEVVALTKYDRDAVLEDLENVQALVGLADALREIAQWVDDSALLWGAEYYTMSLELHQLGSQLAEQNGKYRPLVKPFEDAFAARRKAEDSPPSDGASPAEDPKT